MQDLPLWLRKHLSIVYLPGNEFFHSLHVLANPEHHTARFAWTEEILHAIPTSLRQQLQEMDALSNQFLNVLDFFLPWEDTYQHSIEASLERIRAMREDEFVEAMIGPVYHPRQVMAWLQGYTDDAFEQLKPAQRGLIRHPLATKRSFLEFCYAYLPFFQKEQRRIEPWLIRAVYEAQEQVESDPVAFLSHIHPRLHVHEQMLQFHKAKTYQFAYAELSHIYLVVSSFIAPHLLLGIFGDNLSVGFSVDVPGTSVQTVVPHDFISKMKVFSDPTRVAILKSLLHHPYCTQQLADMHSITEPAVTKHLKLLVDAGFVWSERRGRYVFYRGITARLEQLSVDLHEFIDMPSPAWNSPIEKGES